MVAAWEGAGSLEPEGQRRGLQENQGSAPPLPTFTGKRHQGHGPTPEQSFLCWVGSQHGPCEITLVSTATLTSSVLSLNKHSSFQFLGLS